MQVLVTGGSGYLGETVVRKLRARGDDVRVLDVVDNDEIGRFRAVRDLDPHGSG